MAFPSWLKHQFTDPDNKNFEGNVQNKASIYVPAIGKVTIVVLLRNLLVSKDSSVVAESRLNLRSDLSRIER